MYRYRKILCFALSVFFTANAFAEKNLILACDGNAKCKKVSSESSELCRPFNIENFPSNYEDCKIFAIQCFYDRIENDCKAIGNNIVGNVVGAARPTVFRIFALPLFELLAGGCVFFTTANYIAKPALVSANSTISTIKNYFIPNNEMVSNVTDTNETQQ